MKTGTTTSTIPTHNKTIEIDAALGKAPAPASLYIKWFTLSAFCVVKSKLIGRVLTIIDASIQDHEQRKALKDVIKDAFRSTDALETAISEYGESTASITLGEQINDSIQSCGEDLRDITPILAEGYEYTVKKL